MNSKTTSDEAPFEIDENDSIVPTNSFLDAVKSIHPDLIGNPMPILDEMAILAKPEKEIIL